MRCSKIVTSSDEFSRAQSACSLSVQIEELSRRQFAIQIANPELNSTFETMHRNFSGHFVRQQFLAFRQHDPDHLERVGFHDRPGIRGR